MIRSLISIFALCVASAAACAPSSPGPQNSPQSASRPEVSRTAGLVEVSGGSPMDLWTSRCLGSSGDQPVPRSEVEPQAAVAPSNPDHIVAAWQVRGGGGGVLQVSASFDGGRTWAPARTLPFNACAGGPFDFLSHVSDPWVAIGPEGRVYVSGIAFHPTEGVDSAGAVIVISSPDGGKTWDAPGVAALSRTPEFFHDNTALAADPRHPGTAYVLTTRYEGDGRIGPASLSKTVDGGKTWSLIRGISPRTPGASRADAPQMVIDPRTGHLFVFYTHGPGGSSMSVLRSEDGGESWSPPIPVSTGVPLAGQVTFPGTSTGVRIAPDIGHAAVDPRTGRLYAVLANGSFTEGRSLQVGLVTSGDGGRTWSAPLRVSDDLAPGAWRPALAVDAQGRVAVSYFAPAFGETVQGDRLPVSVHLVEIGLRADGTLTRGKDEVIDHFAWTPSPGIGYFLGDYNPLLAVRNGFLPLYSRSTEAGARVVAPTPTLPR